MENKETIVTQYSRTQQHTLIMQCIYQYLFYLSIEDRPSPSEIIESVTNLPVAEVDKFIKSKQQSDNCFIAHCYEQDKKSLTKEFLFSKQSSMYLINFLSFSLFFIFFLADKIGTKRRIPIEKVASEKAKSCLHKIRKANSKVHTPKTSIK